MVRWSGIDRSIITVGWYADSVMIGKSSPLDYAPTQLDACIITTGWYTGPALMVASSPLDRMLAWHRCLHHCRWMVRWTYVDGRIITIGLYVRLALMVTSSLPDHMSDRRRWTLHHHRMVCWTGIDGYIITVVSYSGPVVVRHRHHRMVRRTDGGKILSPPTCNRWR